MNHDGNTGTRRSWLVAAGLVALAYVVIGLATSALARAAATGAQRSSWRLAAWGFSAVVFVTQILFERRRLLNPFVRSARHASLTVAAGTVPLACAAVVHQLAKNGFRPGVLLAILIWPLLTGIASFAGALPIAAAVGAGAKSTGDRDIGA